MKKLVSLFSALVVISMLLSACGAATPTAAPKPTDAPAKATDAPADAATPTEAGAVAFDADSFCRSVTQGIGPTGDALQAFMPPWSLTRAESDALVTHLNTLQ